MSCPRLLADADIGLVPTRAEPYLAYSLTTKLLEYAAMGVPIIASGLATFRHHFTDDAIRFVPGGDPDALARAVECAGGRTRKAPSGWAWRRSARRGPTTGRRRRTGYLAIVDRLADR